MKGLSYDRYFSAAAILLYEQARELVEKLPETAHGDPLRCHEVARHVAAHLKSSYYEPLIADGLYRGCYEHSWIELWRPAAAGGRKRLQYVLDPYVIARVPLVQLITAEQAVQAMRADDALLYQRLDTSSYSIRTEVLEYLKQNFV